MHFHHEGTAPARHVIAGANPVDAYYAYFLSKIVDRFCGEEQFDFWSHLADHKQGCADTAEPRRKSSFVSLASETGEEGFMPCKRVKSVPDFSIFQSRKRAMADGARA